MCLNFVTLKNIISASLHICLADKAVGSAHPFKVKKGTTAGARLCHTDFRLQLAKASAGVAVIAALQQSGKQLNKKF